MHSECLICTGNPSYALEILNMLLGILNMHWEGLNLHLEGLNMVSRIPNYTIANADLAFRTPIKRSERLIGVRNAKSAFGRVKYAFG